MNSIRDEVLEVIERHNREVQMLKGMFENEPAPEPQETPISEMRRKMERAEYWWAVWFLVCRLYREHQYFNNANDFVEKCAMIQKDYKDMGQEQQWKEAWAIWNEQWEDADDDKGRPPSEDQSGE